MRKSLSAYLLLFVALGVGVALAAQLGPIRVQSEQPTVVTENGQTLELTSVGVVVDVVFDIVTATQVRGRVIRTGAATTGSFRIFWREARKERIIPFAGQSEEQFSLEGGDTDKKTGGGVVN